MEFWSSILKLSLSGLVSVCSTVNIMSEGSYGKCWGIGGQVYINMSVAKRGNEQVFILLQLPLPMEIPLTVPESPAFALKNRLRSKSHTPVINIKASLIIIFKCPHIVKPSKNSCVSGLRGLLLKTGNKVSR